MNNGLIDWRGLFFSPAGRAPRAAFWIGAAGLFLISAIYEAVAAGGALRWLTFWFFYPALLASGACVLSKRLHDRGRSGWWAALVLLALALVWPQARGAAAVLAVPVLVWAAVELAILPGEQGANRFGPNSVAPGTA